MGGECGGASVSDGSSGGGLACIHSLRQERSENAGENVSRSGGGECGGPRIADEDAFSRCADEGVWALQQDDAPESLHGAAECREPMCVDSARVFSDQARELT